METIDGIIFLTVVFGSLLLFVIIFGLILVYLHKKESERIFRENEDYWKRMQTL